MESTTTSRLLRRPSWPPPINRRLLKLAAYLTLGLLLALLLSHLFGQPPYDPSAVRRTRKARETEQTNGIKPKNDAKQQQATSNEPYAGRPRIRTANGHLVIEAGQDKNIEFRTSGARGSVSLNGVNVGQLVGVAGALERLGQTNGGNQNQTAGRFMDLLGGGGGASSQQQFDSTLRVLFTSSERLGQLEAKLNEQLTKQVDELTKQFQRVSKRLNKTTSLLTRLAKRHETLEKRLTQNNCLDLDTGAPVCKNGATCVSSYDSFKCLCPAQFEGRTCEQDVDECQKFRGTDLGCQNGGKCINLVGGYQCECPPDWHGVHCTSQHDDCALSSSAALCGHGKCVNLARTSPGRAAYECVCDQGWTTMTSTGGGVGHQDAILNNPACIVDVNECLAGQNVTSAPTTASIGAYPCSQNPFVECINLPGSFQCGPCPPGYTGNGRVCRDVDECASGDNGGCSQAPLVECINLPGSRRCGPCPPGYIGDGLYCQQVSSCTQQPNGGCHPAAKCHEVSGVANADAARLCICQYPFEGSGVGPAGCTLIDGSTVFMNNSESQPFQQQPQQDDCRPNPCLNGAKCERADANFECICPLGWSGRLCDQPQVEANQACGGHFHTSQGVFAFPVGGSFEQLIKASNQKSNNTKPAKSNVDRQYQCVWSIRGPSNMALMLSFSQFGNKHQDLTRKRIQAHLFNETQHVSAANTRLGASQTSPYFHYYYHSPTAVTLPNCAEYVDVRERLDPTLESMGAQGPLMARLCSEPGSTTHQPPLATTSQVRAQQNNNQMQVGVMTRIDLVSESNLVDIEYSFRATRGQFLEPSLSFLLEWTKTEPACGGELPVAESGALSSPKFPEFYAPGTECRYIIRVPPNKRIRIQFGELTLLTAGRARQVASAFATENAAACADSLTILDGSVGLDRPVLFRYCANNNSNMAAELHREATGQAAIQQPIQSSSSSVEVLLASRPESTMPLMRPKQRKGFYLTYASEPATPGCGGLYTAKSSTIKSADYEPNRLLVVSVQQQQQQPEGDESGGLATEMSRYFDSRDNSVLNQVSDGGNYYQYFMRQAMAWNNNNTNTTSQLSDSLGPVSVSVPSKWSRGWLETKWIYPQQQQQQHQAQPLYKTRCEFEIRPADQSRNHRIQLDWLDMPSETVAEPGSLSRWSRRLRCAQSRLTIMNSSPSQATGDNQDEVVATFCAGDKYNSSLASMLPIASSGHVLYLVYESASSSAMTSSSSSTFSGSSAAAAANRPAGFKLRYSTICTAIYQKLEDSIRTELDANAAECIYHIMLPANYSMSLLIDPNLSEAMTLADGSCAAQAVFMDGAMPRGKMDLAGAERELRLFKFAASDSGGGSAGGGGGGGSQSLAPELVDLQEMSSDSLSSSSSSSTGQSDETPTRAGGSDSGNNPGQQDDRWGYWQYGSSQVHDIKEFDVCKLRSIGIESTWNHMSLMFKLNPKVAAQLESAWRDSTSGLGASDTAQSSSAAKLQLTIMYWARPSCGGIVSEPREASIELTASRASASATSSDKSSSSPSTTTKDSNPLAASRRRLDHLVTKTQLQEEQQPCSWILHNKRPGQPIQLAFDQVPVEEIRRRKSAWVAWKRSLPAPSPSSAGGASSTNKSSSIDIDDDPEAGLGRESSGTASDQDEAAAGELSKFAVCQQMFQEIVEVYEPEVNLTRFICPTDLIESNVTFWTTQSDTVFVRLLNTSAAVNPAASTPTTTPQPQTTTSTSKSNAQPTTRQPTWPGKKPLASRPIRLNYTMLSENSPTTTTSRHRCGGKLIQSSGTISSPRFPFNYPANSNCVWVIEAEHPRQQIRMNFSRFAMEKQSTCLFDYLEIRNGPSETSPLIGRFCNQDLQSRLLVSHSNAVWLRFHSDAHLSRVGFQMHFDGAQTGCGGLLTTPTGQIDSPNYPYASGHSADCEWSIEVGQANRIQLVIDDLDLATASDNQGRCAGSATTTSVKLNDYLEIFDSTPGAPTTTSTGTTKSLGRFCKLPADNKRLIVNSTSNRLFISYKSQALDYSRGFRLSYTTLCSNVQLVGTAGAVESPGYPDSYLPSMACSYVLRAPLASNLTLVLTDLELESDAPTWQTIRSPSAVGKLSRAGQKQADNSTRRCFTDRLRIWSIRPRSNTPLSKQMEPIALPDRFLSRTNNNMTTKSSQPQLDFEFHLERVYCGSLSEQDQNSLRLELNTNLALIEFRSDRALEMRGFRVEWRSRDVCGGGSLNQATRMLSGEEAHWQPIVFDERLNITSPFALQQPFECFWLIDSTKFTRLIEFDLSSDMRSPETLAGASPSPRNDNALVEDNAATCAEASLTMYDGPDQTAPMLARNCNQRRRHETIYASGNKILLRFFSRGTNQGHAYGRNFRLNTWPSHGDTCSRSVLELSTGYLRPAGSHKSPNYPDLYEAQAYKCSSLISSSTLSGGRLRFTIDEIDIPIDGSGGLDSTSNSNNNLQDPQACKKAGNYLLIRGVHGSASPVTEYFCGKFDRTALASADPAPPRSVVVLEQQTAFLDFVTSNKSPGGANLRGRWKVTYDRLCGHVVRSVNAAEEFSSPNYPSVPDWPASAKDDQPDNSERVCIWRFSKPDPTWMTKVVGTNKLHLSLVDFISQQSSSQSQSPTDCLRVYEGVDISLKQSRFNLTDLDSKYQAKMKICTQKDIKYSTLNYLSRGSELTVIISGNAVAKFRVRRMENYCGGDYQLNRAEFASPDYPQPYGPDLDCHYFISGPPGSSIKLKFLDFDLPEGDGDDDSNTNAVDSSSSACDNVDHIEIRQLPLQRRIALKQRLLHKQSFISSEVLSYISPPDHSEVQLKQQSLNQSSSPVKQLQLLNETNLKTVSRLFDLSRLYYIMEENGHVSNNQLASKVRGQNSRLSMRLEQFYSESNLIGRFCGKKAPTPDQLQDELLIRFRSHTPSKAASGQKKAPRGFLLSYSIESVGNIQLTDEKSINEDHFLSSPMYPEPSSSNSLSKRQILTRPEFVLQFELVSLTLGSTQQDCKDTLAIYDGLDERAPELSKLCGHLSFKGLLMPEMTSYWLSSLKGKLAPSRLPIVHAAHDPRVKANLLRPVRTSSNMATVVYNNLNQRGAFLLRYRAIKKSELALNEDLLLNYSNASVLDSASRPIEADEVLKDQFESSLGPSKSCSRLIQLGLKTSAALASGTPPKQMNLSDQAELSSPDYPNEVADKQIECHWLVFTHDNTNIQLIVDPTTSIQRTVADSMDQQEESAMAYSASYRSQSSCLRGDNRKNFVVVYDGASTLSPILARQCLPAPPIQLQSSGRHMLIRYVHSESLASLQNDPETNAKTTTATTTTTSLFKASARVGKCGGQYYVMNMMKIQSDGYSPLDPSQKQSSLGYSNNLNCVYYIFSSSPGFVLSILGSMSDFDLSNKPTNSDCSVGDYIELRELALQSEAFEFSVSQAASGRSLGRFCAGKPLANEKIETPTSAISLEFHTDQANTGRGFQLLVVSNEPLLSCPRGLQMLSIEEPYGRLSSPNWPHGFMGRRRCRYNLVAPRNKSIELTFLRLKRPERQQQQEMMMSSNSSTSIFADTFDYMADNEALSFRYHFKPLREVRSAVSGTNIRKLIKEVASKAAVLNRYRFAVNYLTNSALMGSLTAGGGESSLNGSTPIERTFSKISSEQYRQLLLAAPWNPIIIRSKSHVLTMEYSANSLLPNEGFLAVFQLVDLAPEDVCGGDVYSEPGKNVLQSARFNEIQTATADDDDDDSDNNYIQCDWVLKLDTTGFDYSDGSRASIEYNLLPTRLLEHFKTSFLVFQVLETPTLEENFTLIADELTSAKSRESCGLTRLLIDSEHYWYHTLLACGNLTTKLKWSFVSESSTQVSLRTKNLPVKMDKRQEAHSDNQPFYRGLRAFFYETSCLKLERLVGESLRIRSHIEYESPPGESKKNNQTTTTTSAGVGYQPGICKWHIRLVPGHYEVNLGGLNLRKPRLFQERQNTTRLCEPDRELDLDYIEFKSSMGDDSPVLARFCAYNQATSIKQHRLALESSGELVIIFVAGLDQLMQNNEKFDELQQQQQQQQTNGQPPLQYGFDLQVTRVKNFTQNEFCDQRSRFNIYKLIRNKDRDFFMLDYYDGHISSTTLYPKNVHCDVQLSLDDDFRFNLTFVSIFDIEPSKNCSNDYVQIDDLVEVEPKSLSSLLEQNTTPMPPTKTTTPKTNSRKSPQTTTTTTTPMPAQMMLPINNYEPKLIGRWCGRNLPKGSILSKSNRVRLTFHSNDRIEGKGFLLEWSSIRVSNQTSQDMNLNILQ